MYFSQMNLLQIFAPLNRLLYHTEHFVHFILETELQWIPAGVLFIAKSSLPLSPRHLPWNNFCVVDPKFEIVWLGAPCSGNNVYFFSDTWTSSICVVNRQRKDRFNVVKLLWYELRKQFLLSGHFLRQMWTPIGHLLTSLPRPQQLFYYGGMSVVVEQLVPSRLRRFCSQTMSKSHPTSQKSQQFCCVFYVFAFLKRFGGFILMFCCLRSFFFPFISIQFKKWIKVSK